jgi:hypothetical protein
MSAKAVNRQAICGVRIQAETLVNAGRKNAAMDTSSRFAAMETAVLAAGA